MALARLIGALAASCLMLGIAASPAPAEFGFQIDGSVTDSLGETYTRAGGHPDSVTTTFVFNTTTAANGAIAPDGAVKDVHIELPPGLIGNPRAVAQCEQAAFAEGPTGNCPKAAQVGTNTLLFNRAPNGTLTGNTAPVYSIVPPPGAIAEFGFRFATNTIPIIASIRVGRDYGVTMNILNVPQALKLFGNRTTFWGVPTKYNGSGATPKAFLSMPTACLGPQTTTMRADSWGDPGNFKTASFVSHDTAGEPVGVSGCDELEFAPELEVRPTTAAADSPAGLEVDLHIPQEGLEAVDGVAPANLKHAVVTMPEGLVLNPSAAGGLGSCSLEQIELHGPNPARCPEDSKIGTVAIDSPLIDHSLEGGVYQARQRQNELGSLLAIYVAVEDPRTGVVIKLAAKVAPDPQTGRLTTTFADNPQLPFEDFELDFFGGPRAALMTPPSCGTYSATGTFSPWSGTAPVSSTGSFQITSGPDGGPCPSGAFDPKLEAGTVNPVGGSYSPLVLRVSRADGTNRLSTLGARLPEGLLAKLRGIPYCPDASLAAVPLLDGTAASQLSASSCPAASQIGNVSIGTGAGPSPFYLNTGRAYLAGPYKGAPLSIAFVTPAMAGPFDLGNTVVRTAVHLDPATAQITAVSDSLPTILHGIPLDLRDVRVSIDRDQFTLNPTSCDPAAIDATITSTTGQATARSSRFQVGSCGDLRFKPRLALRLKGGKTRNKYPALTATLRMRGGEANIRRASVALPSSELLAQNHIRTVCTRMQWDADQCPAESIYGQAEAVTPLLDEPLRGPVYLRSSGNPLPDLVADLQGQIDIELVGRIDSVKGGIRTTFASVPDAPVSGFVLRMRGGKKGLLVNSTNICRGKHRATVRMNAHNGRTHDFAPALKAGCGKKAK
jgi:hypothetical protein